MKPPPSRILNCCPSQILLKTKTRTFQRRCIRHLAARMPDARVKAAGKVEGEYHKWNKDALVEHIRYLEAQLKKSPARSPSPVPHKPSSPSAAGFAAGASPAVKKARKQQAKLDPNDYETRFIALKLAYLGRNYGGFEYSSSGVLPSVEEELFKALTRACLIFPKDDRIVDFSGLEYSKCGRTDRGVSAFGQVIALRVKSAKPSKQRLLKKHAAKRAKALAEGKEVPPEDQDPVEEPPFDPVKDELQYCKMLNRMLPRDIRILAWCPAPGDDFSARFSCRGREYRYFFTQPAFNPPAGGTDGQPHAGWLDIDAMRDAAKRFEGEQDFQNFCKIDPAKNITSYKRGIIESDIYEADDMSSSLPYLASSAAQVGAAPGNFPKVYYFRVKGTAFLWHQIRHMVSILFHVGQGLEKPSLVTELLDTETNPGRPTYVMADEIPLVLWDCTFPDIQWIHADEGIDPHKGSSGAFGAVDGMWRLWREIKMDEILANGLLRITADEAEKRRIASATSTDTSSDGQDEQQRKRKKRGGEYSMKKFEGGNGARANGTYIPVMQMRRMEPPQVQNDRFAQRKGFANHQELIDDKAARFQAKMDVDADE